MGVVVRLARAEDMAAVRELVLVAGLPLAGLQDAWRIWVAEDGGELVGTGALERHDEAFLLRSVAVTAERRGQGIGGALVTGAVLAAQGPVALLTEDADPWFARFGFRHSSRAELDPALERSPLVQNPSCESAHVLIRARDHHESALMRPSWFSLVDVAEESAAPPRPPGLGDGPLSHAHAHLCFKTS